MAKRGETRPWRMTYQWPSGPGGTETFLTLDRARDAARAQVSRPGIHDTYDCAAIVTHRAGMDMLKPEHYRACPNCRRATRWDSSLHQWRHDESDALWCATYILPDSTTEAPEGVTIR